MIGRSTPQDFEVLKKLGQGSYSSVFKVLRKSDGIEYAMKKVKMNGLTPKEKQNALNEVRILASVQSPYIVGYKEAFFDQGENTLFIILEYIAGGDLQTKIEYVRKKGTGYYLDEGIIWTYFIHMLKGLNTLHKNNIFHRDIKCANLFLTKDHKHLKLGDLNVAKVTSSNILAQTQAGTPYYASPEVWRDQPYDSRCDIWSLGCVVYEMAALKPPFLAKDLDGLQKKVNKGLYDPIHSRYSKELSNVISKCLQVNPKQRLTSDQLLTSEEVQSKIFYDTHINVNNYKMELLNTIVMPKNLKELKNRLPKPNYATEGANRNQSFSEAESRKAIDGINKSELNLINKNPGPDEMYNPRNPIKIQMKRTSSQSVLKRPEKQESIQLIYQLKSKKRADSPRQVLAAQVGSPIKVHSPKHPKRSESQNSDINTPYLPSLKNAIKNIHPVASPSQNSERKIVLPVLSKNPSLVPYAMSPQEEPKSLKKLRQKNLIQAKGDSLSIQNNPIIGKLLKRGVIVENNKEGQPKYKLHDS